MRAHSSSRYLQTSTALVRTTPEAAQPVLGFCERFEREDRERVERVLQGMAGLQVEQIKVGLPWRDWSSQEGRVWLDWLLPRLGAEMNLLVSLELGEAGLLCGEEGLTLVLEELDTFFQRLGGYFSWVELLLPTACAPSWGGDAPRFPDLYDRLIVAVTDRVHAQGKKVVLGNVALGDGRQLFALMQRQPRPYFDALGLIGYPRGTGWSCAIRELRELLGGALSRTEIWITETGFSTHRHEERRQLSFFLQTLCAGVHRIYWRGMEELASSLEEEDKGQAGAKTLRFALQQPGGYHTLLYRIWAREGLEGVRKSAWLCAARPMPAAPRPVLITGGAGFIGTNLAHYFLQRKQPVLLLDNLSRRGSEENLHWLRKVHGERLQIVVDDVRNREAVLESVQAVSQVYHLAGQVSERQSLVDPVYDFEVNLRGTLHVLEALRSLKEPPPLLFASSEKIHAHLAAPAEDWKREWRGCGCGEKHSQPLQSPLGCSKGAASQYVLDYFSNYGISALVFHLGSVYGPHQFGQDDQEWVCQLLLRSLQGCPLTLPGDGRQVRDLLFVEDLVEAMVQAMEKIDRLSGQAYTIGGGYANSTSLLELVDTIGGLQGRPLQVQFDAWSPSDSQYSVCDNHSFYAATGWRPRVSVSQGMQRLHHWLSELGHPPVDRGKPAPAAVRIAAPARGAVPYLEAHHASPRSRRLW